MPPAYCEFVRCCQCGRLRQPEDITSRRRFQPCCRRPPETPPQKEPLFYSRKQFRFQLIEMPINARAHRNTIRLHLIVELEIQPSGMLPQRPGCALPPRPEVPSTGACRNPCVLTSRCRLPVPLSALPSLINRHHHRKHPNDSSPDIIQLPQRRDEVWNQVHRRHNRGRRYCRRTPAHNLQEIGASLLLGRLSSTKNTTSTTPPTITMIFKKLKNCSIESSRLFSLRAAEWVRGR